jgi:GntR family transcriptional regulator, vanillate catabolism transcriptional regulator
MQSMTRGRSSPQILRAVLRLREMILTGGLEPGKRVPELKLVGTTGVSRTPLRIAMEQLAHEGLLERRPRGGFVVRAFTVQEIEHAIDVRGVLEGAAARAAAERHPAAADLVPLTQLVLQLDAVVRELPAVEAFERYVALNEEFHRRLLELSGNQMLGRLMAQVSALPFASPSAFVMIQAYVPESHQVLLIGQEHHRTLVDAIARGEGTRAEAIAREHARLALRNLDVARRDRARLQSMPGAALINFGS